MKEKSMPLKWNPRSIYLSLALTDLRQPVRKRVNISWVMARHCQSRATRAHWNWFLGQNPNAFRSVRIFTPCCIPCLPLSSNVYHPRNIAGVIVPSVICYFKFILLYIWINFRCSRINIKLECILVICIRKCSTI